MAKKKKVRAAKKVASPKKKSTARTSSKKAEAFTGRPVKKFEFPDYEITKNEKLCAIYSDIVVRLIQTGAGEKASISLHVMSTGYQYCAKPPKGRVKFKHLPGSKKGHVWKLPSTLLDFDCDTDESRSLPPVDMPDGLYASNDPKKNDASFDHYENGYGFPCPH